MSLWCQKSAKVLTVGPVCQKGNPPQSCTRGTSLLVIISRWGLERLLIFTTPKTGNKCQRLLFLRPQKERRTSFVKRVNTTKVKIVSKFILGEQKTLLFRE